MKAGTNRPSDLDVDAQIRAEVERIRKEYPFKGDYREQLRALIETLFFRFGERAGAQRLVNLLADNGRSPSTGTAQDEINQFWNRIRESAQIRLRRADLPEFLLEIFGKAAADLWEHALNTAEGTFGAFRSDADVQIRAAESRAAESQQRADEALERAEQATEHAREANALREEMAVRLSAAESARSAAEQSLAQLRTENSERDRQRAEEAAGYQRTIEQLRDTTARFESEQRKLMVIADDYKTAAARDREALQNERENGRAINQQMLSLQGAISRLSTERGVFEGRAVSAENLSERLQEDRDRALAEAIEAGQRASRAEARATNLEHALQAAKAKKNVVDVHHPEVAEKSGD